MEVTAVLEALRANPGPVHIYSDSTYVVKCFNDKWYQGWLKRDWKNSQKKPVANRDLWEPFLKEAVPRFESGEIKFFWVKGHAGDLMNEAADQLAVAALEELKEATGYRMPSAANRAEAAMTTALDAAPEVPWDFATALIVVGATSLTDAQEESVRAAVRSAPGVVVSGLRRGAELVAAEEALVARRPLGAVLPFADPASRWPEELRARFDATLARAEFEIVLQGDPATPSTALQLRNHWLEKAALGALVVGDSALAARFDEAGLSVIIID